MQTTFDKMKWPELTEFRQACLDDDYETMGSIADRGHHWYKNENPNGVELATLAKSYQAQYAASVGDLAKLQELKELAPMALVSPWTAQKWLPISQAACSHGDREIIDFLITSGADPRAIVGSEDEQASVVEMAKFGKNKDLPAYLKVLSNVERFLQPNKSMHRLSMVLAICNVRWKKGMLVLQILTLGSVT